MGLEEGANPTPWGYSRAGHREPPVGEGAAILPFALDESALTPSPPPHPLNKQYHPLHPPHTQQDLVPRYPQLEISRMSEPRTQGKLGGNGVRVEGK